MRKPDRFEQMVDKMSWKIYAPGTADGVRERREKIVTELLRRQFTALRRLVTQIEKRHEHPQVHAVYSHGFVKACEDIRKEMDRWRKETR